MEESLHTLVYIALGGLVLGFTAKVLQRLAESPRGALRVVCLGDSITANGGYCRELATHLPKGSKVKVFGYAGQGTKHILSNIDDVLAFYPTDVVILAGVNDLPRKGGDTVAATNLLKMYATFRQLGIRVTAVQITPWHGYPTAKGFEQNTYNLNSWIAREAVVDAVVNTSALGDNNYYLLPEYSADGLHLTAKGQKVLGGLIATQSF